MEDAKDNEEVYEVDLANPPSWISISKLDVNKVED